MADPVLHPDIAQLAKHFGRLGYQMFLNSLNHIPIAYPHKHDPDLVAEIEAERSFRIEQARRSLEVQRIAIALVERTRIGATIPVFRAYVDTEQRPDEVQRSLGTSLGNCLQLGSSVEDMRSLTGYEAEHGRLCWQDMSYDLLARLEELVNQMGVVVGPIPAREPRTRDQ